MDLIERQAAQTELMMKCERYTLARESHGMGHVEWSDELIDLSDAMDAIRDLPPAQPEARAQMSSADLISRQETIDAVEESRRLNHHQDGKAACAHEYEHRHFLKILRDLPSAQPDISDINVGDMISREVLIEELNCINLPVGNETVDKIFSVIENMPSAQPEPIRINLNEPIKVKLTDWGKEIYYHQYDRTNQIAGREICKPRFPREDENGYTEFQLWCFMELYGEHIGITLPNVIEPLEIVYER